LPTDDKLAEPPRKKFYGRDSALRCPDAAARRPYLPGGDGLGASLPDSIIEGRIGPSPSGFVLAGFEGGDDRLCSIGVSLFTGLGVSATTGLGNGAVAVSGWRVFFETDRSFNPSAARSPAVRISSSVSVAEADFFSRDLDLRDAGVGVSEEIRSEGWIVGVGTGASCFFSRGTITSCACTFPTKTTPQSSGRKNCLSMMPPDKRMNPLTSPRS
jgi:hypothetical protein